MPESGKRTLADGGRVAVLEPPGIYRVELVAGEEVLAGHDLRVLGDPNVGASEQDLADQLALVRELRDAVEASAGMINRIEELRVQLRALRERSGSGSAGAEPAGGASFGDERIAPVERALEAIEDELFDLRMTSAGQDTLRWKRKLYARLTDLFRRVHQSDYPPTDQQRAVAAMLLGQLAALRERYDAVLEDEIPALESSLRERGLAVVAPRPSR
jgi:hypothetical protein